MSAVSGVTGALVAAAVLLAAGAFGLWWRARQGRFTAIALASASAADPALTELGVPPGRVTLLQFSSRICAPCRATSRLLADLTREHPAVVHVEVDVERHPDAVEVLAVRRTPTLFVVDRAGRVVERASGQPTRGAVEAVLRPLLAAR